MCVCMSGYEWNHASEEKRVSLVVGWSDPLGFFMSMYGTVRVFCERMVEVRCEWLLSSVASRRGVCVGGGLRTNERTKKQG